MGTQIECKVIEPRGTACATTSCSRAAPSSRRSARRSASRSSTACSPGSSSRAKISNIVDFRRVRRPRRHRRPDPHLGALLVARQPSERGARDRRHRAGQGARHRPRAPAHLTGSSSRPRRIRGSGSSTRATSATSWPGTVTKVVTFGAFVEILDGVEGLVHISELAAHHVENPREIVQPGDELLDQRSSRSTRERRRLSLSAKRVEGQGASRRGGSSPTEPAPTRSPPRRASSKAIAPEVDAPTDVEAALEDPAEVEAVVEGRRGRRGAEAEPAEVEAECSRLAEVEAPCAC